MIYLRWDENCQMTGVSRGLFLLRKTKMQKDENWLVLLSGVSSDVENRVSHCLGEFLVNTIYLLKSVQYVVLNDVAL